MPLSFYDRVFCACDSVNAFNRLELERNPLRINWWAYSMGAETGEIQSAQQQHCGHTAQVEKWVGFEG